MSLFPARAGVILWDWEHENMIETFPRTRGGDPNYGDYE